MAKTSTKVFVMEVMGRHAGWITAAVGLAADADNDIPLLLLFPERPFDQDRFLCVHVELLTKLGVTLVEHLRLSAMAADRCYQALLVVAPLLVTGGTGSPVNPIAIG